MCAPHAFFGAPKDFSRGRLPPTLKNTMIHYLDNSATTAVSDEAAQKALMMMTTTYGNPSSLHRMGIDAEREVESAREKIASSLSVDAKNIIFTSGGSEANNTVILGASDALRRRGNRVLVSAAEHPSVLESARHLLKKGFDVAYIPVDKNGIVKLDELERLLTDDTVLVSVMCVNNETGAVFPTEDVARLVHLKSPEALFHADAVQAFGKIPLKPKKWDVDFMTVSAHKIHGPKGVGALFFGEKARFTPLLFGGEQQKKLRPGTEAAPLIAAFGEAVSSFEIQQNLSHVQALNDDALKELSDIDGVFINSPSSALPYIINISVDGVRSETMLHHLASLDVFISSSSACSKGKKSHVLKAMGFSDDRIDSSLRISFSKYNEKSDVDALIAGLKSGLETLQRKKK